jgi:hypothetical protein
MDEAAKLYWDAGKLSGLFGWITDTRQTKKYF